MKNEEHNIKLAAYIEQLQELRKEATSLATGIIAKPYAWIICFSAHLLTDAFV